MPLFRQRQHVARGLALGAVALASLLTISTRAEAQAFQLNDVGTCALARGYATTGAPCKDASDIYWNPGAASELSGFSFYGGAAVLRVIGGFTADTTGHKYNANAPIAAIPSAFINYANTIGGHRYAIGLGFYTPYGLISQWRADFPGDFASQRASLSTFYIQPNLAYEIIPDKLSIGAGPVIGHSDVRLDQYLDLSQQQAIPGVTFANLGIAPGTAFGVATAEASGTAVGFNVGVHYKPTPDFQLGARFLSKLAFNYTGTAKFRQVPTGLVLAGGNPLGAPAGTPVDALVASQFTSGALTTQGVKTSIAHPYQFQVGVGYTGISQTTLSLDYELSGWSAFNQLPIQFTGPASANSTTVLPDYHDSWSIRTGIEHVFGDPLLGFVVRAGFSYINTPAPDVSVTPILPDMDRYNWTVGFGYPFSKHLSIDGGYVHVGTEGRRGSTAARTNTIDTNETAAEINNGFYTLAANLFSLSLKLTY
jgi:long-chain fatty acid transport protein